MKKRVVALRDEAFRFDPYGRSGGRLEREPDVNLVTARCAERNLVTTAQSRQIEALDASILISQVARRQIHGIENCFALVRSWIP